MLYMLTGISDCCFVYYGAKKILHLHFYFFIYEHAISRQYCWHKVVVVEILMYDYEHPAKS